MLTRRRNSSRIKDIGNRHGKWQRKEDSVGLSVISSAQSETPLRIENAKMEKHREDSNTKEESRELSATSSVSSRMPMRIESPKMETKRGHSNRNNDMGSRYGNRQRKEDSVGLSVISSAQSETPFRIENAKMEKHRGHLSRKEESRELSVTSSVSSRTPMRIEGPKIETKRGHSNRNNDMGNRYGKRQRKEASVELSGISSAQSETSPNTEKQRGVSSRNKESRELSATSPVYSETLSRIESTLNFLVSKIADIDIKICDLLQRGDGTALGTEELIDFGFPLNSLRDIEACEDKLADEKAETDLIKIISIIGGRHKQEIICAALSKIFSNKLALLCSWKGQKGNFAVRDTRIMKCLKNYCCGSGKVVCTESEFKTIVMNWFRVARQRYERQTKK